MGELSDRFAALMARMAHSDAELFRTIGAQNANLRQMVQELADPEAESEAVVPAGAAPEAAALPPAGLLAPEACALPALKARFGKVAAAQSWVESQIGPAPKKATWAVIEQTCRSGAWPVAAAPRSTAASKALTAVQLEERLGRLEQRLEQRFDQLETLIALIGQAIAAPQQH